MKKLMGKLKVSNSVKNVSKISAGTILGQIISFIVVPIYTRIYGASIMGTWTVFSSIANIIVTFSDLGLKNAIMVEKKEEDTLELYTVITTFTLIISIISGLVVYVFYSITGDESGLSPLMIAGFVVVLAITLQQTQTCYTWLNKKEAYSVLMKNPIVNNLSAAIIIIVLGVMGYDEYGYYIGLLAGQLITLIHMRVHLPNKFLNFNLNAYKKIFAQQKQFYLYQLPANVLAQVKEQTPVFLIRAFFGSEILGYYSISMRYLKMPINLLAQSIGRVYFQTVSRMKREGQSLKSIGEYSLRNINKAMKIAVIPMIAIIAIGDVACEILFGTGYEIAGSIMRIVAFNSFFLFLSTATNGLPVIISKQKYMLISAGAQMIGYAVGLSIGYYVFNNIYMGCLGMTVVYAIVQIVYFAAMFKCTKVQWKTYVRNALASIFVIILSAEVIRVILLLLNVVNTL